MNYGLPYQGSKSKICEDVINHLPTADNLYDLFAGGCAVTDIALRKGLYNRYIVNDISDVPALFVKAVNGEYANEKRWISREDFYLLKDTATYVRICWSFGNNGKNYMYSQEVEPWKKSLHFARVYDDYTLLEEFGIKSNGSYQDVKMHHEDYRQKYIRWWLSQQQYTAQELDALISTTKEDIYHTEEELRQYLLDALKDSGLTQVEVGKRLGTQMQGHYFGRSQWEFPTQEYYEQMQTFMPKLDKDYNELVGLYKLQQRLESLQRLQSLQSLQSLQKDYRDVEILPNSVLYCDIPYKGTCGYVCGEFDHKAFYKWAREQRELVVVSEYTMPDDFVCVWKKDVVRKYSGSRANVCPEGLFVPKHQLPLYQERMRITQGLLF